MPHESQRLDVLEDWDALAPTLRALDPAQLTAVDHAVLLAPLQYPRKVLGAGANYYAHLAEMGVARPAGPVVPYFFFKPPTGPVTPSSSPSDRPDDRLGGRAGRGDRTAMRRRARGARTRGCRRLDGRQ